MKRIIATLTIALAIALFAGTLLLPSRPARAQGAGTFTGGCSDGWTSAESFTYNGHSYSPKRNSSGNTTVCVGSYGDVWILAYKDGVVTDLTMIQPRYPLTQ